jgi:hypothetical protein
VSARCRTHLCGVQCTRELQPGGWHHGPCRTPGGARMWSTARRGDCGDDCPECLAIDEAELGDTVRHHLRGVREHEAAVRRAMRAGERSDLVWHEQRIRGHAARAVVATLRMLMCAEAA